MRVGIPRALFYYHYYPMWRAFFDTLGVECVVSPPTHKGILADGVSRVTGETCLPAKIYFGHVLALVGQVDYLFAPLIRTLGENEENCPRLLGLPDLVRALIPEAPPILAPEIEYEQGTRGLVSAIFSVGWRFTRNPLRIKHAADRALEAQRRYREMLLRGVSAPAAIEHFERGGDDAPTPPDSPGSAGGSQRLTLALLGHGYILHDWYTNHRLEQKLSDLGVELLASDAVPVDAAQRSIDDLNWQRYWTYEHELVGAAAFYLSQGRIDGMVAVAAFGCGPDAVMLDVLQELAGRHSVPLLNLVLDEHTGEAGLVTRIEAFVDMLSRKATQARRKVGEAGLSRG